VAAGEIGLGDADWLERSLVLRREHECTHLFTQRAFGAMRNHALDELLADFAGLLAAFGEYRPELARRFLGVEPGGGYRTGGRLQNYRGQPSLSDAAFAVLVRLVDAAVAGLERAAGGRRERLDAQALRELVGRCYRGTLADLAEPGPAERQPAAAVTRERVDSLDEAAVDRLMTRLAEFAGRAGVPMAVQLELRLVLDELLSNLHKYGGRDGRGPAVEVEARVESGTLTLAVGDDGPPFDPLTAPGPRLDTGLAERAIGGLGLHLVRQLMHEARYERAGGWNRLRLRRSWGRR
jgi:anti-sigma regulatory factor (Ser/Thr protein kinase)